MGYFAAFGFPLSILVGASGPYGAIYCTSAVVPANQYLGFLDELRVFSVELLQNDVYALYSI